MHKEKCGSPGHSVASHSGPRNGGNGTDLITVGLSDVSCVVKEFCNRWISDLLAEYNDFLYQTPGHLDVVWSLGIDYLYQRDKTRFSHSFPYVCCCRFTAISCLIQSDHFLSSGSHLRHKSTWRLQATVISYIRCFWLSGRGSLGFLCNTSKHFGYLRMGNRTHTQ